MKHRKIYITALLFGIIFLIAVSSLITDCPKKRVSAETNGYLRVITDDTPFYADKTADAPLFYLPYTYYVRVMERGDFYTHVEYAVKGASIDGYVPTNKLFSDGLTVTNPFPSLNVTTPLQYVFEGRSLYYYGKYLSAQGKTLYYVGYNDRLGYVKEEDLVPFTLTNHPNELTFLTPEEPEAAPETAETPTQEPAETQSVFNIRIAIIAVLGLAGFIALIVALGKKPKAAPAASYYDENDYE